MTTKYFKYTFGQDGDLTTIPDAATLDGSVSYDIGFGVLYQTDPATTGLNIPRAQFNKLMNDVTKAIQQYQQFGFPDFITTSDNGGTPFSYSQYAFVRYSGATYYSLVNSNTSDPTDATKWAAFPATQAQAFRTADTVQTYDSTLPAGWLWLDGSTIGDGSSGATGRANADASALFTTLWNSISNTVLPIQDSTGAASTRGISAAADFAAHKRLPIPDERGRVVAGADNLGGTAANRLTSGGSGIAGTTLGASGGVETVSLTGNQNGAHTHSFSATTASSGTHNHGIPLVNTSTPLGSVGDGRSPVWSGNSVVPFSDITANGGAHTHTVSGATDSAGIGSAHQNTQPTIIVYKRIKL